MTACFPVNLCALLSACTLNPEPSEAGGHPPQFLPVLPKLVIPATAGGISAVSTGKGDSRIFSFVPHHRQT